MTDLSALRAGGSTRAWRQLREKYAAYLPCECGRCGALVTPDEPWDLGHSVPRALGGTDDDVWPEHRFCSRSAGMKLFNELQRERGFVWDYAAGRVTGDDRGRSVVVLFGPPAAGKTSAARSNPFGLQVFDRDDGWLEPDYRVALAGVGRDRRARAVVIRTGATRRARWETLRAVRATHGFVLPVPPSVSRRRLRERGGGRVLGAAVSEWWRRHREDGAGLADVGLWAGWDGVDLRVPLAVDAPPAGPPVVADSEGEAGRSDPVAFAGVPWLADLFPLPPDAAWPRWMSPPHPDAVGSYGPGLEAWALTELGVDLRWWQRLAFRRQLEHDKSGALVWGSVVESTPRRAGKSLRLRVGALWRMAHPELFGEPQLVLHTGKDLAIAREIHRQAWRWAEDTAGWLVMRANGKEAIESRTDDRWLCRAVGAVYGYDVTLGYVDEAWAVEPGVVDEGLEPGTLERSSPQVVLTSTAHRRASSLMRRRIQSALTGMGEDWRSLLMVWGAGGGDQLGDPAVWRAASPHWSPARFRLIEDRYERAMRGEADPAADDPDPLEGFKAQYLNVWPPLEAPAVAGEPVVTAEQWERLGGRPRGPVAAAAVEAWFGEGCAVAVAVRAGGGRFGLRARAFPSVAAAGRWIAKVGPPVLVAGKTISGDPALRDFPVVAAGARSRESVEAFRRLLGEGVLCHDGSPVLTQQVLGVRTKAGPGGMRLVDAGRLDAVKAAVWAVAYAREGIPADEPAVYA